MFLQALTDRTREAPDQGSRSTERRRLAYELGELVSETERIIVDPEASPRTAAKAREFLTILVERAEEHGPTFFQPAFLLNFVGEAYVRANYLSQPIIAFLGTELYFYGLSHIDKFHRSDAFGYMTAHADLAVEFASRDTLKQLIKVGQARLAEGRPFCLVHNYLNALKRKYWASRRAGHDAVDRSISLDLRPTSPTQQATPSLRVEPTVERAKGPSVEDRVTLMIRLFATRLSDLQQRIYLLRHPLAIDALQGEGSRLDDELLALVRETGTESSGKTTWPDIASRYGLAEKSAKREYLRSLLLLLEESSAAVHGAHKAPSFVRRVLASLRAVTQERDLKLRDGSGRGLGQIIERWEIALRLVLNDIRVGVDAGHRENDAAS